MTDSEKLDLILLKLERLENQYQNKKKNNFTATKKTKSELAIPLSKHSETCTCEICFQKYL